MDIFFNNHSLSNINLPYAIYELIGEELKLFETSQYLINLLGVKDSSELIEINLGKTLHQADKECLDKAVKRVVTTKQNIKLKTRLYNFKKEKYLPFIIEVTNYEGANDKEHVMLHFIPLEKGACLFNTKFVDPVMDLNLWKTFQRNSKLARDLESIQKARNTFSAKMSHDLRTPLNAIINFAQFGFNETNNLEDKTYFEEITTASNYMLDLLNNLLEFDKIELKELTIHKKTANSLVNLKSIYSFLNQKAKEKDINFTTNINTIKADTFVVIDVLKKKQVISNILSNSIKYTPRGGNIDWTIKTEIASNGKHYEYHIISDDGIGMSEEFQQKMFLPFIRENSDSSENEDSSGLGLSIVKSIIDTIGGEISCKSKLGEGTTFKFKIPVELASKEVIEKYKKKELENSTFIIQKCEKSLKLLVCEDNKVNQKIIKMILEKNGFNVTLANNGQEGLALAKANNYSLIIMDIRMPILNGLDTAKAIRSFDQKTPIIALSANAFESDIKKSKEAGMNEHLLKPIDRRTLLLTINELTKGL